MPFDVELISVTLIFNYASPSSGEAYRDRQLTTKFEFWLLSWNFLCADMFPYEDSKTMSVCLYPEKRNHADFVNISLTLVNDTSSMERSLWVLQHGNQKIWIFLKKFEIDEIEFCPYPECPYPEKRNRPGFVDISPTLVADTSMERSSWVLQYGDKLCFFFSKNFEIEFWLVFWLVPKSWNHLSVVNISPTLVIDTSMERSSRVLQHENPKIWIFSKKVRNWGNWILSVPRGKKWPWLR